MGPIAFEHKFSAAVAFYPYCAFARGPHLGPLLILVGDKDDWIQPRRCHIVEAESKQDDYPVTVKRYDVVHGFDIPQFGEPRFHETFINPDRFAVAGGTLGYDAEALADVLSERRGKKVRVVVPKRGNKLRLLGLAAENARVYWLAQTDEEERHRNAMRALAEALELPEPPRRIECFDNSNLQGTNPVAAMAVFIDGKPDRREYRRYKVKTVVGSDDYATMREIVQRRFRRAIDEDNHPDLLLVDGGKGQLGVAMAVLEDLGLFGQAVAGIAKPRTERRRGDRSATDKIVLPHRKEPLRLGRNHPGLRILQHIRDEAHNHAVRYHRQVRGRSNLVSVLEGIPGVGPSRRKALLRALGSAERVASASVNELSEVAGIGPGMAQQIHDAFRE